MPEPTLAEDIRAVRDHIAEHGWHQGYFYNENPDGSDGDKCCIMGAAHRTLDNRQSRFIDFLEQQLVERGDFTFDTVTFSGGEQYLAILKGPEQLPMSPIPYFNDDVLKDKDEVLSFLDKAAIAAEEKA